VRSEQEIRAAVAEFAARGPWYAAHAESFEENLREIDAEPEFPQDRDALAAGGFEDSENDDRDALARGGW